MYREKLPSPGRGLPLMEEKKQKKIKASPRPGSLAGYMIGLKKYREKLPSPFSHFHTYPAIFAGGHSRLDFLLFLFLYQDKKRR